MRNIVSRWLKGKQCVGCGQVFGEISWVGSPPALFGADKKSVEWKHIPADHILEAIDASAPVCFACHTAMVMVREHPELVIDRHRTRI